MVKRSLLAVAMVFLMILMTLSGWASVPTMMNYQGKLTDLDGNPLTGSYNMTFYLFTAASGGSAIWSENHTSVAVTDGIYNVILGSINPLATGLFNDNDLVYLEVEIDGESLVPRQQLTSVPYALKARVSDAVVNGGITTVMIADGAVDSQKLDDDAVTGTKIADGTVSYLDIQDGSALAEIVDNDGSGSGLDADMLDGLQASDFVIPSSDYGRSGVASNLYEGTSTLSNRYINDDSADTMQANTTLNLFSAIQNGTGRAIYAESAGAKGIEGKATGSNGAGVSGYCYATGGIGVFGQGTLRGVHGYSSDYDGYGVVGEAPGASGEGVRGIASGNYGRAVVGEATYTGPTTTHGGHFTANSSNGRGVYGESSGATGTGVYGIASNAGDVENYGGYFVASGTQGRGVYGEATNIGGDEDSYGIGVYGTAAGSHGRGVYGTAADRNGFGVYGSATNTEYTYNYGGYFRAYGEVGRGVVGRADGESGTGVYGFALGTSSNGVYGHANGRSGIGVYGYAGGESGHAVYGWALVSTAYAGYFNGRGYFSGYLEKPGGGFKIDHPLDPENKYLNHSFVESNDMMNIYNGNVVLDRKGEAWVELPEWFEALNKDFRYQLTCIGAFAQVYIAQELSENRFKISGGKARMKVSWQVTGIRQDPWANANRVNVEKDKVDKELGYYLHPELYGEPEEKSIEWARHPVAMRLRKEAPEEMRQHREEMRRSRHEREKMLQLMEDEGEN